MDKYMEHMFNEARDRYANRFDEHPYDAYFGIPDHLRCTFCIADEMQRWRNLKMLGNFNRADTHGEAPSCSCCPLLNAGEDLEVLHNCVTEGMRILNEWEEYFDGEDSKW